MNPIPICWYLCIIWNLFQSSAWILAETNVLHCFFVSFESCFLQLVPCNLKVALVLSPLVNYLNKDFQFQTVKYTVTSPHSLPCNILPYFNFILLFRFVISWQIDELKGTNCINHCCKDFGYSNWNNSKCIWHDTSIFGAVPGCCSWVIGLTIFLSDKTGFNIFLLVVLHIFATNWWQTSYQNSILELKTANFDYEADHWF